MVNNIKPGQLKTGINLCFQISSATVRLRKRNVSNATGKIFYEKYKIRSIKNPTSHRPYGQLRNNWTLSLASGTTTKCCKVWGNNAGETEIAYAHSAMGNIYA